jgi:hypothetical protein
MKTPRYKNRFDDEYGSLITRAIAKDNGYFDECYVWKGKKNRQGYAMHKRNKRQEYVARRVFELKYGSELKAHFGFDELPSNLSVLRMCGCKACIKPTHLMLG